MKKQRVYNLIILDESGSMSSIHEPTVSGFNEMVETMKQAQVQFPGQEHFVTLVTFNGNGIRTKLERDPVADIHKLEFRDYCPSSVTPLYDAIGQSVTRLAYKLDKVHPDAKVLVTILTDGEENASREYRGRQVKQLIEDMSAKGWLFTFIGTEFDVDRVADELSIPDRMSFNKNPASMQSMFQVERKARNELYSKILNFQEEDMSDLKGNFFKKD